MQFDEVLPAVGPFCAFTGRGGEPSAPHWFDTKEALGKYMLSLGPNDPQVWFSHASYKRGAPAKKNEYVRAHRAFVFDIDVQPPERDAAGNSIPRKLKPDGSPACYATYDEAMAALVRLCARLLPPTFIVNSGYGMHVYWVLGKTVGDDVVPTEIEHDLWVPIAQRLKAFLKEADPLLAGDTARVSDGCGLLRWPGTWNHKYGYRVQTTLKRARRLVDLNAFASKLPAVQPLQFPTAKARPSSRVNLGGVNSLPPDGDAQTVLNGCGALDAYRQHHQASASRDVWWKIVQMCAYIDGGDQLVHELSYGPKYDEPEVRRQYAYALKAKADGQAPIRCETLCNSMALDRSVTCAACPLYSSGSASPVNLALKSKVAPPPVRIPLDSGDTEAVVHAVMHQSLIYGLAEPAIPHWLDPANPDARFCVLPDGTLRWRALASELVNDIEDGPNDGSGAAQEIIDMTRTAAWPLQRYDRHGKAFELWARWRPGHKRDTFEVPSENLHDVRGIRKTLRAYGVNLDLQEHTNRALRAFMKTAEPYVVQDSERAVKRFGWTNIPRRGGDFVIGGTRITPQGLVPAEPIGDAASSHVRDTIGHAGTVKDWCEILRLIETYGSDAIKLGVLLSFAAPLFVFSGESGILVHFWSPESSLGKTSINRIVTSVWGRPFKGDGGSSDSQRGLTNLVGVRGTTPACIEELTSMHEKVIADLSYMIEAGKSGTVRDGTSGRIRDDDIHWATIAISNGNLSLLDKLGETGRTADARTRRLFEVRVDRPTIDPLAEENGVPVIDLINNALGANYGMVGVDYMRFVVRNQEVMRRAFEHKRAELTKAAGSTTDRFFIALRAAAFLAGTIMHSRGYWTMSRNFIDVMIERMHKQYATQADPIRRNPVNLLAAYITANDASISIEGGKAPVLPTNASASLQAWGTRAGGFVEYLIPQTSLVAWGRRNNYTLADMLASAEADGSLVIAQDGGKRHVRPHPRSGVPTHGYVVRLPDVAAKVVPITGAAPDPA